MKQSRILCSTGAFIGRYNNRNYHLIGKYASGIHCDGFEFMMYPGEWYENRKKISDDLIKTELDFPVFHADKKIGEWISRNERDDIKHAFEVFEENCELANRIGSEKMVLHLWGGIWSDKHMDVNIRCFEKLNRMAEDYDLLLTVENVVCNQKEPMTYLHMMLKEYPEITFTFDTKMAAFHEQLDEIYQIKNERLWSENHIGHIHINDYAGGYMDWENLKALHIGDGHIDFGRFFKFIKMKNYTGDFTLEAGSLKKDGTINLERLNQSLDAVRAGVFNEAAVV